MIERASHPIVASQQAFMLVLYVADVSAVHGELASAGLAVGTIHRPFHAPDGLFRLSDPDGFELTIRQQ